MLTTQKEAFYSCWFLSGRPSMRASSGHRLLPCSGALTYLPLTGHSSRPEAICIPLVTFHQGRDPSTGLSAESQPRPPPTHKLSLPLGRRQLPHVLLASLLPNKSLNFFFFHEEGFFSLARAGLEQTGCCVGDTKGSLWEVSAGGGVQAQGARVQGP